MKKSVRIGLLILTGLVLIGLGYWQYIKKDLVKDALEKAVSQKTDSLYYVKYESSTIDEVSGNASFKNIVLQSDSLQEKLYFEDTSITSSIINIKIEELNITGANIPSFLSKNTVEAKKIEIIRPRINIIQTGKESESTFSAKDSLALYDRITGKFKSIKAGEIVIEGAVILFSTGKNKPHTKFENVNIDLKNLVIDSTRNYDNLVSYFVKDVVAKVQQITAYNEKNGDTIFVKNVEYNAPQKFLRIGKLQEINPKTGKVITELSENRITGISTTDFVLNKKIKADSLTTNGGILRIYRTKQKNKAKEEVAIDNDFFNQAAIKNLRLSNISLQLYNKEKPNEAPFILNKLSVNAYNIEEIQDGTNVKNLLGRSKWDLSGDGLSIETKDHQYKISLGNFKIDKSASTVNVSKILFTPLLSEAQFVKKQFVQKDQFNFVINDVRMSGVDVELLINEFSLSANEVHMQPLLKIFNDRLLPFDTASKVGKYPHQQLTKLDFPLYIKTIFIHNGNVSYRERGRKSEQIGNVFFSNIEGKISNVTNIKEKIAQSKNMVLEARTKFLGVAQMQTIWTLPLNTTNGAFTVTGSCGPFDATKLNAITEPLGLASIQKGNINKLTYGLYGTDLKATGDAVLLYDHLKIELLKSADEELKKKGLASFIANLFTKDQNPSNGVTRTAKINYDRDISKSFFNLIWKSIFSGAKKIASGKNDGN